MFFGHTEPYKGNSMSRHLSPVNSEHMQSEKHFWVWISLQHSGCRVGNPISLSTFLVTLGSTQEGFFLYFNYGHDMKPIAWWSYRVRVKSSLVLLEMLRHPYPTLVLVVLSSAKSIERTHLDCLGNLISHLFIRRGCVRMRKSENNFSFSGVAMHRQTAGYKPVQPVGIP